MSNDKKRKRFHPLQRVNVMVKHAQQPYSKLKLFGPEGLLATEENVQHCKAEAAKLRSMNQPARVFFSGHTATPRQKLQRQYQVARRQILGSFGSLLAVVNHNNCGELALNREEMLRIIDLRSSILSRLSQKYDMLDNILKFNCDDSESYNDY